MNDNLFRFYNWYANYLQSFDIPQKYVSLISVSTMILLFLVFLWFFTKISSILLRKLRDKIRKAQKYQFLDLLLSGKFINTLVMFVPLTLFERIAALIWTQQSVYNAIANIVAIIKTLLIVILIQIFLKTLVRYLKTKPSFQDKPMDSFSQIAFIFVVFCAIASTYINITNQSLGTFFTALGAVSAVLLLLFKDTILGVVSSIQVSTNNMVKIGDWITFNRYGADGTVTEINLTTVKIQNFDNTITTVPTYSLVSDAFQNWRGMTESGARRIKRAIKIRFSSVRLLTDNELEKFMKVDLLKNFIAQRIEEIHEYNQYYQYNREILVNGRNLTNLGLFRQYIENYIHQHEMIRQDLTCMVRQLESDQFGIPIEVYCFTSDNRWVNYEKIQADIFDHIYAVASYFDLTLYEY